LGSIRIAAESSNARINDSGAFSLASMGPDRLLFVPKNLVSNCAETNYFAKKSFLLKLPAVSADPGVFLFWR
jgi:hypothetical protein